MATEEDDRELKRLRREDPGSEAPSGHPIPPPPLTDERDEAVRQLQEQVNSLKQQVEQEKQQKQEAQKREQEAQKREQEEKHQKQEAQKREQKLEKQQYATSTKRLLEEGLLRRTFTRFASPPTQHTSDHIPLHRLVLSSFSSFIDISSSPAAGPSQFLTAHPNETKTIFFSSEVSISRLVHNIIHDAARLAGLTDFFITEDISIITIGGALRPDLFLVTLHGRPLMIVECKSPDVSGVLDDVSVLGQVYDYLSAVRSLFGMPHIFAVVTNLDKWRLCWLPETDELANATARPPSVGGAVDEDADAPAGGINAEGEAKEENEEEEEDEQEAEEEDEQETEEEDDNVTERHEERILHGTVVIEHCDLCLVPFLMTAILKARDAPSIPIDVLSSNRSYITLAAGERGWWQWSKIARTTSTTKALRLSLPNAARKLYVVRHYNRGADGRALLCLSLRPRSLVVLKIFTPPRATPVAVSLVSPTGVAAEESAGAGGAGAATSPAAVGTASAEQEKLMSEHRDSEYDAWLQAWGIKTVKCTYLRSPALMMPVVVTPSRVNGSDDYADPPPSFASDPNAWVCVHGTPGVNPSLSVLKRDIAAVLKQKKWTPDAVKNMALERMNEVGLQHNDVKWAHVGLLPKSGRGGLINDLQPVLIDLCRVSRVDRRAS